MTSGTYGTINTGVAFGGPSAINQDLTYRLVLRKDYSDGFIVPYVPDVISPTPSNSLVGSFVLI